jgi:DNA-binding MarR family transcriptional regulator
MLDFELLRAFVAVADCGGFHRAAERLNLTQSTISQQIKRLEFETKRPLFRRTTRSVALTDDGEAMRAACCNSRKRRVIALRRRGYQERCVSAWWKKLPAARCRRRSAALRRSIRA